VEREERGRERERERDEVVRLKNGRGGWANERITGFIAMRVAADTVGVNAIGCERVIRRRSGDSSRRGGRCRHAPSLFAIFAPCDAHRRHHPGQLWLGSGVARGGCGPGRAALAVGRASCVPGQVWPGLLDLHNSTKASGTYQQYRCPCLRVMRLYSPNRFTPYRKSSVHLGALKNSYLSYVQS
jgi:hypothetical protein